MVFSPKYAAVSEEGVILNVLELIERDFKEALDFYYPSEDLPDFAERSLGQEIGLQFPILVIAPKSNPEDESDDGAQLAEEIKIDLFIGVTGESPVDVTTKIMRYVRTLSSVLRTEAAEKGQSLYVQGMNPEQWMGFSIEIKRTYGPFGSNASTYFRPAALELTVRIRETLT